MAQRQISVVRIAAPLRTFAQRFAFALLLVAAGAILVVGRTDPLVFERARMAVTDFVTPILGAASRPIATVSNMVSEAEALMALKAENDRLRRENERLQHWQQAARAMQAENEQLRALLAYDPGTEVRQVTARVVGDRGGAFLRSILINRGLDGGVEKGQAAVTGDGLVGRVASVGDRSARVLQITDLNSRIPVMIEETRDRAILAGDNSPAPQLLYVTAPEELAVGQRIVTSGHGDAFPPGIPVGEITAISEKGVRVSPFASADRLEYVRLLDFGKTGILKGAGTESP